jgi:hypothetical protein
VQWTDPPATPQTLNYPPSNSNAIYVATPSRMMKLVPVSWEIHSHWITGLSFLLRRSRNTSPFQRHIDLVKGASSERYSDEENSADEAEPAHVEVLSDSDIRSNHRRVHTIISDSNSKYSTPKAIRKQHFRMTTKPLEPKTDTPSSNPFITENTIVGSTKKPNPLMKILKMSRENLSGLGEK